MIFSKKTFAIYIFVMVGFMFFFYINFDRDVAEFFLSHIKIYEHIGDTISILGESHWYLGAGLLGFLYYKKRDELYKNRFLFLLYANIFSGIISLLLKWFFGRIRPWGLRPGHDEFGFLLFQNFDMGFVEKMKYHFATVLDSPTTYSSFPSGHTITVFTAFTYLSLLFPKYTYLWLSIAVITACSRVLANDHFISDIFAGALVGTISTLFIYSKMKNRLGLNYEK